MRTIVVPLFRDQHGRVLRCKMAPTRSTLQTAARVCTALATHAGRLSVTVDELTVLGSAAFVRGTLHVVLTPRAGGAPIDVQRRYVELWRNESGAWKVARTMDNFA